MSKNTIAGNKKIMLNALKSALGIISVAVEKSGIEASVFKAYYNKYPEYKKSVDEVSLIRDDFVESKLINQIKENNPAATVHYLKRKDNERKEKESKEKCSEFRAGNQFWRQRSSHGRNPKFSDPVKLWDACCQYFEWVESNPLKEQKLFHAQGIVTKATLDKMRAMTIVGMCIYIDISRSTLDNYRNNPDLLDIITRAEDIIRTQKFEGASADMLNPNIIARELGLSEKLEVTDRNELTPWGSITALSDD